MANSPGIEARSTPGALVTHCDVSEVAHCRGVRWDSPHDAGAGTTISYNHVHHCGCGGEECLSDGGGPSMSSQTNPFFFRVSVCA